MKKNNFDPFMINNFSSLIKNSSSISLPDEGNINNDLISMNFLEKSISIRTPKVKPGLVLVLTSNSFGDNIELGHSVMKGFLTTISGGLDLPEHIIFMNTGVKLTVDKDFTSILRKIKKYGTNMIASLEAIEYFEMFEDCKLAQKWSVGEITTMIMSANKLIKI